MKIIAAFIIFLAATQSVSAQELLLFGGRNNDTFLGCATCSKYDSGSICNKYGDFGSRYSDSSIWNRYGTFGSKYNSDSPWNKYSSDPPVVVDRDGNFYGYFTSNKHHQNRTRVRGLRVLTDNVDLVTDDLQAARDAYCGDT
ncbi:hypothetical protein [Stenotrophomonas koreensis]|uniref:hypothetical protein n=1 Tax=Stenotrophomonas koreensis TaxID=266128 RepID=UPI0009F9026E|nr:hypothetical protein [Stenotrophomonas koreensis]